MILDRWDKALCYLGISPELDMALRMLHDLTPQQLEVGKKIQLDSDKVFYSTNEITLSPRAPRFEFHQKYIDIHVPITGTETIALCAADSQPKDTPFDTEKDMGLFEGQPLYTVTVPAGWFCLCMPGDAHVPCMGEEGHAIVKMIVKVRA
ncbi:MAG: YhcH/YjgK/YiaL family protein [Eubacteriales bacterium]|nr:YhcH/YjgK/YiaL family protein [Eubacteriales bacterium]